MPDFAACKDKFMVQTTVLNETEQIDKDTFVKDTRPDLKEYRLRVAIEGPAAPPSPVPEANEADDEAAALARSAAAGTPSAVAGVSAVPAASTAAAAAAYAAPGGDERLRSTLDSLAAATSHNEQLKSQVERLQRERDELRRQVDMFQMQASSSAGKAATAAKPKSSSLMLIVYVLIASILAFLLGQYRAGPARA
jgi:hypothetical protein